MVYQFRNGINRKKPHRINPVIHILEEQQFMVHHRSFTILKMTSIPFPPQASHHTMGNHPPNYQIPMITNTDLPSSPKMQHLTRHHPSHPKKTKHHRSQLPSQRTMQRKMINTFTTMLTQTTPIYNDKMTLPQVINSQKFPQGSCPREESYPWRDFRLPNNLSRKRSNRIRTQTTIVILDCEPLSSSTPPAQPIFSNPLQRTRVK